MGPEVGALSLPDLACPDDPLKTLQLLFKRYIILALILGIIHSRSKQRQVPVWPVDLKQVQVICPESLQAVIHALLYLLWVHSGCLASYP